MVHGKPRCLQFVLVSERFRTIGRVARVRLSTFAMRLRYGKHCNDLRRGIRYATRVTSFAPGFDRVRDSSALIRLQSGNSRPWTVRSRFRPSCGLGRRMQSSRLSFTKATMMLWRCTSAFRGVKFSYLWKISSFYYFGRTHVFIFQCRAENVWVSHSPSQSPFVNLHAHGGCDQYRTFINEAPTVSFYGPHRLQVSSLRFPL